MEKPNFKKMCLMYIQQLTNFPYIEKDFDALTDYALLCKVVAYLNKIITNENQQNETITALYNAFVDLKDYVDNLDVQDEINNKLDEMAKDGTLQEIISSYLNSKAIFAFDNVESMKNAKNLINGSYAKTLGYYETNDGGNGLYKITDEEIATEYQEDLGNGLYATLIINNDYASIKQFGAKGDGITDDTSSIQNAIDYGFNHNIRVLIPSSEDFYKTTLPLQLRIGRNESGGYWGGLASYIEGENKATSRIVKIGHLTDNNATDSTFVARNSTTSSETGTGITLKNLSIEHYDDLEFNKTSGLCLWSNISRSTLQDLNIIGFNGFNCACFSTLFENILFNCNEEALHLTNGTSNLFRFLYAPSCINPYFIQSQYSTLLNVCCDAAKGDLYTIGGMGLTLQNCGCESKNATNIFVLNSEFTTLSIRDFYMYRQIGDSSNDIAITDCSILKTTYRAVVDIENISIAETEHVEDISYFFNITENLNLATNVKNIRYYKNYQGTDNEKIKMWKDNPALKCMQRLSTPTMSFNYCVSSNNKIIPFIGGYSAEGLTDVQGECINVDDLSASKTLWLDCKTKYTTEDGYDIRYTSKHSKGDVQFYNDPLSMNALGLSITSVTNAYTWETNEIPIVLRGTTTNRPTSNLYTGLMYFDTTLGKPIWYNGTNWVDATGTQV